jgi:hypothetical protein
VEAVMDPSHALHQSGPDPATLWKQYELFTDLLKHYLKLVLEVNVLHYAVTDGIVSFCFSRANGSPYMKWALILPIAMSLLLGSIFILGNGAFDADAA